MYLSTPPSLLPKGVKKLPLFMMGLAQENQKSTFEYGQK